MRCYLLIVLWSIGLSLQARPTEIVFWHAMAGTLGEEVNALALQFNQSQSDFLLKPIYKGSYIETLTAYAAAYRAHVPPALVQVFEVGRSSMLIPQGLVKSVSQLYREQKISLNQSVLWPAVLRHYAKHGELLAMPFNISFPVIFYNATRFHESHFPKTWQAFEKLLFQLKQRGEICPYTSAYPSWIHIESYMALQGLTTLYQLKTHLKRLKRWRQQGYFEYAGRVDEATTLFTSGKCILFSQSSGAYQGLKAIVPFKMGMALMPIEALYKRHANVVGGGALWVSQHQDKAVEKGIVAFFQFFMQPEIQKKWAAKTGYFPILKLHQKGVSWTMIAAKEWGIGEITSIPFAQYRIRGLHDEILELLFANLISVNEALARLTQVAQEADRRFAKNYGIG